jgi:hypothetical protein
LAVLVRADNVGSNHFQLRCPGIVPLDGEPRKECQKADHGTEGPYDEPVSRQRDSEEGYSGDYPQSHQRPHDWQSSPHAAIPDSPDI